MILITVPLALNATTGVSVWTSNLSLVSKIVITVILAVKLVIYFNTVLMDASDRKRSVGLIACVVANILLTVFFVWNAVWNVVISIVILIILAIIWGSVSGFTFKKED